MGEITDQGYVVKTQNEYFDEEIQLYQNIDPKWNLDPSTPDGIKAASDAEIFGNLDEQGQLAYNSKDPSKARGVELNVIGALTGSFRDFGTQSNVALTLGGVPTTTIIAGNQVKSAVDDTIWSIDADATISGGGTAAATATAVEKGATQASIGTITQIQTTVPGWQTVTNPSVATPGTDAQTDAEFRLERAETVGLPGNNQVDSILGSIGTVDGVRRFRVYENDTGSVDGNGLPAHSIAVIVDGGTDDDVAFAIYLKKNPGVLLHPAATPVVVVVTSPNFPQNVQTITFSRPIFVDIIITVDVTDDGTLPGSAAADIKQAILDYVNGSLLDPTCGFNQVGFGIGEDVVHSRFYTPVNQVIGQFGNSTVTTITINAGTTDIVIAFNELSRFTDANITVSIT